MKVLDSKEIGFCVGQGVKYGHSERLALGTSALESFYNVQFTFSGDKTKFSLVW